ncbi:hypothetical protein SDC9_13745 [bioreactor metagenome]|uniref:AAA+ ATPase domain-containing protein n=1 Tax=bioreactor metagenome TaxID=1076179 RepID=A0A644TP24_9ZZZZ|nr:ATP-binding protein [Negativicutes bacterium]
MLTELNKLIVYRDILKDPIIKRLLEPSSNNYCQIQYQIIYELLAQAEQLSLEGNVLKGYLLSLVLNDENIFCTTIENTNGKVGQSLLAAVAHDLAILKDIINSDLGTVLDHSILNNFRPTYDSQDIRLSDLTKLFTDSAYTSEQLVEKLVQHYNRYGHGVMAQYAAFRWSDGYGLTGVKHYDQIKLEDIIGYDRQKEALIKNTEAFLNNQPANNVLLVGARGTGKSSSVKALVNRYFSDGLRLIEIAKHQLKNLHEIMSILRNHGKKFILYLDDLSFEDYEVEYKYLKSVLDGGVESKPPNVMIIATSNRRHIVRELWNERGENNSEIHRNDAINEKISLSDRFGITLTYLQPNQDEYLKIVEELAKKQGLTICPTLLRTEALKWELSHSGRSGRTAQQFISYLLGSSRLN